MEAPMTQRDVVFPAGRQALYERNRYWPAIKSNGFLFVSGQVGSHEDGSPEPDQEAQIRLAFTNLNAILRELNSVPDYVRLFGLPPAKDTARIMGVDRAPSH